MTPPYPSLLRRARISRRKTNNNKAVMFAAAAADAAAPCRRSRAVAIRLEDVVSIDMAACLPRGGLSVSLSLCLPLLPSFRPCLSVFAFFYNTNARFFVVVCPLHQHLQELWDRINGQNPHEEGGLGGGHGAEKAAKEIPEDCPVVRMRMQCE